MRYSGTDSPILSQHHLMIEFLTEARHHDIQIFLLILRVIAPYIGLLQIRIHQVVVLLAIHNNDTITKPITKAVPSRTTNVLSTLHPAGSSPHKKHGEGSDAPLSARRFHPLQPLVLASLLPAGSSPLKHLWRGL